jgi:dTMP kinase
MVIEEFVMNKHKGILIVCEGISGSGKSEGVNRLVDYFQTKKYPVAFFEWNSNRVIRRTIFLFQSMKILSPTVYSILQWLSFLIDYFMRITPFLRRNYVVIVDRYVYTGLTRDIVNNSNRILGKFISHLSRKPDMILFYDTGLHICYERIKSRGKVLFHPNQAIHRNNLLKNKELYYLKKLLYQYHKLLEEPKLQKSSNIIFIKEIGVDICNRVNSYIIQKFSLITNDRTMEINPNESICYRDRY